MGFAPFTSEECKLCRQVYTNPKEVLFFEFKDKKIHFIGPNDYEESAPGLARVVCIHCKETISNAGKAIVCKRIEIPQHHKDAMNKAIAGNEEKIENYFNSLTHNLNENN